MIQAKLRQAFQDHKNWVAEKYQEIEQKILEIRKQEGYDSTKEDFYFQEDAALFDNDYDLSFRSYMFREYFDDETADDSILFDTFRHIPQIGEKVGLTFLHSCSFEPDLEGGKWVHIFEQGDQIVIWGVEEGVNRDDIKVMKLLEHPLFKKLLKSKADLDKNLAVKLIGEYELFPSKFE